MWLKTIQKFACVVDFQDSDVICGIETLKISPDRKASTKITESNGLETIAIRKTR